ncbi:MULTISPECIES: hypothetical protein [unclassified Streptomyces]|uniref:hypothetical protein n=1 Tax=unclassified Streptomyces TaxID=2593676 RepID=UPI002DD8D2A5|nr:hypothetical protein [Streptomyces sp. NBC_01750]WSB05067.1 hypothetical protein OIE54_41235 [Streptomyces sp. NBC_01794]WSD30647.1 hypothetical protein OG966_00805 [Streptomyces sp. NBC_01750]
MTCQQLFFANLQWPKNGGSRVGKAGRRPLKPTPLPEPHRVTTTSTQLTLFTVSRDFHRFDRELHADLANPWLIRARQAARALGEARGWSRWITSDVNRALVIVLSGFREGESIRYSELFPALRVCGLPVVRIAEVLDRLGLFVDDRAPAVDRWLERKLDGMPPGIHRAVEAWVRTTRATRNLTATLERLRVDRQLEEALTHGADPLHLALVFGIDEKTAIRYADSARQLLQADVEADPACSPRTHRSTPDNGSPGPSGSR